MKNILSLIVLLVITLMAHAEKSPNGQDYTLKSGAMYFADNKDGSLELVDADAFEVENMVIPDEVEGKKVTSIRNNSFTKRIDIYSVEIGANVTSIGASSFESAEYIEKVDFSKAENLKIIGKLAFSKTAIKNLTIVSECQINNAFFMCTSLEEVKLLKPVTNTLATFQACSALNKIEFSDEQAEIGQYFLEGTAIESITIPKNVQIIALQAFNSCKNLSSLSFADGSQLARIESYAFKNCTSLKTIKLPETVTYIDSYSFDGYNNNSGREIWFPTNLSSIDRYGIKGQFERVYIPNMELFWKLLNNVEYAQDGMDVYINEILLEEIVVPVNSDFICTGIKSLRKVTIPDNSIQNKISLKNCTKLETVTIGKGQTTIDSEGFRNCASLTTLSISEKNKISMTGTGIFRGCSSLKHLDIQTVESIPLYSFEGCTSLETINFPNVITSATFDGCIALKSVNMDKLSDIVSNYGGGFTGCVALEEIDLPSLQQINGGMFKGCASLKDVKFAQATLVGEYAFLKCESLEKFDAPNVTTIVNGAFSECNQLKTVEIPNVTKISHDAFYQCTSLGLVNAPNIVELGNNVFYNCAALTKIETGKLEKMGYSCFYGCGSLQSFDAPLLTLSMLEAEGSFDCCKSLKRVSLPLVTVAGNNMFSSCTSLSDVNMPSLTTIKTGVFYGCTSLKTFDFSKIKEIAGVAFYNCSGLTDIDISSVESIDNTAFKGCTGLLHVKLGSAPVNLSESTQIETVDFMCDLTQSGYQLRLQGNPATVVFHGDVNNIPYTTFDNSTSLQRVEFQGSINGIFYAGSFGRCTGVKEVFFTNFDNWLSFECRDDGSFVTSNDINYYINGELLKDVTLKDVSTIRNEAFVNSTIESLVVEPSQDGCTIGNKAFYHCNNLKSVVLGDGITTIGEYAFDGCNAITEIKLPSSVTSVDLAAFQLMGSLKHVTLSPQIRDIPSGMLYNTGALETLILPEGVETVGYNVVAYNCNNLRFISLPSTLKQLTDILVWGNRPASFSDLHKDVVFYSWNPTPPNAPNENFTELEVHVPVGCKDAYMNAPAWSRANIIDDLLNDHDVKTGVNSITIRVLRNTTESGLQINKYKVYMYKTDNDGNNIAVGIYEYDTDDILITHGIDGEQEFVVEGLESDTKYTYKLEGYTKADDLVLSTSGNAKTQNTTGITNIHIENLSDGDIYNMQGIKVNIPGKSVYIKNGKKYINR